MQERLLVKVTVADEEVMRRAFPPGVVLSIGRSDDCHLQLNSKSVSRVHAEVSLGAHGLQVKDRSVNGTLVEFDGSDKESEKLVGVQRRYCSQSLELVVGPYLVSLERVEVVRTKLESRRAVHQALLAEVEIARVMQRDEVDEELNAIVKEKLLYLVEQPEFEIHESARSALVVELRDEALYLGPLTILLEDATISEIMVVDASTIYIERYGRIELSGCHFTDDEAVRSCIERIISPLGRRLDEASPMVDARLPDGSRVNAVIPPLAIRGPCLTIRKFSAQRLSLNDLVRGGSLNEAMADLLVGAVRLKKNILVSGGTGSGKTTLLNLLSAEIDESERIITIEDAAELSLVQNHVVSLESKPPNLEGRGAVTIRELLKNALRMRPDRILVGECRGGEALDMLQAMNTGHEGSMTTTHANSPAQALERLETLCLFAGAELPLAAIRRQIAASIHLIIQQNRLANGRRLITSISEVVGLSSSGVDGAQIKLRTLFFVEHQGTELVQRASGYAPTFLQELSAQDLSSYKTLTQKSEQGSDAS